MNRRLAVLATALLLPVLAGCAPSAPREPEQEGSAGPASRTPASAQTNASTPTPEPDAVVGTVVRFTSDRTTIDVTIGEDSAAVRDFLSMLPLETSFEDLSGREKIGYLPRELTVDGSPGSDPEDGDLIYYTPWGNLGFYYDAAGVGYSDATLHLGTYEATPEQLALLEGGTVTIEVVG